MKSAASQPQETAGRISPHRQTVDQVVAALGTDIRSGLTDAEAQARLGRYGPNELAGEKPVPAWRRFVAQFQHVLVILLLVATATSAGLWLYERDAALPYEALAIFAVVLLNATMGRAPATHRRRRRGPYRPRPRR